MFCCVVYCIADLEFWQHHHTRELLYEVRSPWQRVGAFVTHRDPPSRVLICVNVAYESILLTLF